MKRDRLPPADSQSRAVHVSRCRNPATPVRVFCRAFGIDLSLAQARLLAGDLERAIFDEERRPWR